MTLEEKLRILSGQVQSNDNPNYLEYSLQTQGVPRLGVPTIHFNEGTYGFASMDHPKTSTAFPSGLSIAATWDPSLAYSWGSAMSREFQNKGAQAQLAPNLGIARVPSGGNNHEFLSGEDPYLGYEMAKSAVQGIQINHVMAVPKGWMNNNSEQDIYITDEIIDERTRFELYYPPFEGAIEAGVKSIQCSKNKVNGKYVCENEELLNTDLRERLGFDGYVMSEVGATRSASLEQGLDQEMPDDR